MHEDGLDLVPVVVDDDTYRQAYDVVANTTLWYCHHHLFDLPLRPRFDRHWRQAWDGYRAYNRAMADVVVARAGEGDAVLVQDYHFSLLGRMLAERAARPARRALLAHALRRSGHARGAARRRAGRAARRHGRLRRLRLPLPQVGGRLPRLLRGGRAGRAPATFVAPLGPDAEVLEAEAAVARRAPRGRGAAGRGGRAPRSSPDRPHGALQEHRARDARLRGAAAARTPSGGARWCTWRFAYPSRQGLAEYLAYARRRGAHGRAHQPRLRRPGGWTPIVLSVAATTGPARSPRLTLSDVLLVNPVRDGLNLVAKEGPLLNGADGVLVLSRQAGAWEELALGGGGALGVNPFDVAGTADALHAALTMDAPSAARAGGGAARRGARRAPRPTGGPTSWRPLSAERPARRRRRRPGRAAAPPRRRRRAPTRSAAAATAAGLSASTAATRTACAAGRPASRSARSGGEGGQVADVVAEGGGGHAAARAAASCSATRARTTVPLSTSSGGRSSRSWRPGAPRGRASACWRSAKASTQSLCSGARRQCSVTVRPLGST